MLLYTTRDLKPRPVLSSLIIWMSSYCKWVGVNENVFQFDVSAETSLRRLQSPILARFTFSNAFLYWPRIFSLLLLFNLFVFPPKTCFVGEISEMSGQNIKWTAISDLRYVDDTVLLAENQKRLT